MTELKRAPDAQRVGGDEGPDAGRRDTTRPASCPSSRSTVRSRRDANDPALVRAAVDDAADKTWLHTHAGELTYAETLARVERAASALRARGVGAGDRVRRHAAQHAPTTS